MAITNANLVDLYDPSFRAIFRRPFAAWPKLYKDMFTMKTSDRKSEKAAIMTGLGYLVEKASGADFTYADMAEGYALTQTHKTFALGVNIAEEALEDDLFDQLKQAPQILSESYMHSMELSAADVFNNGFTDTAAYRFGDAKPLFHTAHPRLKAGTFANKPTTDVDLSVTALNAALVNLRNSTDHNGLPQFLVPEKLMVTPDFEQTAVELTESTGKPGTANNDLNYIKAKYNLQVIVNPYLSDSDAWFVLCKVNGLKGYIRVAPQTKTVVAESNGNLLFRIRSRWQFTVDHPFGVYGSSGG